MQVKDRVDGVVYLAKSIQDRVDENLKNGVQNWTNGYYVSPGNTVGALQRMIVTLRSELLELSKELETHK